MNKNLTPAATVLVLKDSNEGVEVLMVKRSKKSPFGNLYVFCDCPLSSCCVMYDFLFLLFQLCYCLYGGIFFFFLFLDHLFQHLKNTIAQ